MSSEESSIETAQIGERGTGSALELGIADWRLGIKGPRGPDVGREKLRDEGTQGLRDEGTPRCADRHRETGAGTKGKVDWIGGNSDEVSDRSPTSALG
jgi:hypothetical protein